jgi:hypothetical protein
MQNEINELRNQVRTLKRMLFGVFGLVVVGGLLSATTLQRFPDVIQAKKFEVVNDEGKVVASFSANMGGGMLSFSNKDGEVVAGLGSDEVNGGGVLGINNKDGKRVAGIHADENGGVARVFNNKFTEVAGIRANAIGMGRLSVRNTQGKPVAALFAGQDGMGRLSVRNKDGDPVALLSANADGDGVMMTSDSKGTVTSESP